MLQHSMTYGAIAGVILIIFSVIMYMMDIMPTMLRTILLQGLFTYSVVIILVIVGTKSYRDKVLGGNISYSHAFLTGLLIVVFCSVLNNFYGLVFNLWLDPQYMERFYTSLMDMMYNMYDRAGLPDAQIDQLMTRYEEQMANYSPMTTFFSGIFASFIGGTIVSLITSAFIKKNPDPFTITN